MARTKNPLTFRRAADAQVAQLRRVPSAVPVTMGYAPGNSEPVQPVSGDAAFAFFKDPPDLSVTYRLFGPVYASDAGAVLPASNLPYAIDTPVPDIAAFAESPTLDVRGIRLLLLCVEYFPNSGVLELIVDARVSWPEGETRQGVDFSWFPIGVLDPAFSAGPPDPYLNGGSVRLAYGSEIRVDGQALTPASPIALTLAYDVTTYADVRVRAADVVTEDSGLNLLAVMVR